MDQTEKLIIDIIDQSLDFAHNLDYMILASNINTEKLRVYLIDNGFEIINDFLTYDNGKYYDIIKAKFGNGENLSIGEIYYGKDNIVNKSEILKEKLDIDYKKNTAFKKAILEKSKDRKSLDRIEEKLHAIEEIRKQWKLEN